MSEPMTRRTLLAGLTALGAGAVVGCRTEKPAPSSGPATTTTASTTTTAPIVPPAGDDWPSIDPVDAGWDPKALAEVVDFVGSRQSRAFMVVLDGRILAERTWGTPDPFRRDVASAQKSVVAVLAALAHAAGDLDLDAPVERYLGSGWSFASAREEREITVHHLLTMTSGLGDDLRRAAAPGSVWDYNNNAYHVLQPVLENGDGHRHRGPHPTLAVGSHRGVGRLRLGPPARRGGQPGRSEGPPAVGAHHDRARHGPLRFAGAATGPVG